MKHLGKDYVIDYLRTHYSWFVHDRSSSATLLIPHDKMKPILLAVDTSPFFGFLGHLPKCSSEEIFECDIPIQYDFDGTDVIIRNEAEVRQHLLSFSKMVIDVMKSAAMRLIDVLRHTDAPQIRRDKALADNDYAFFVHRVILSRVILSLEEKQH